jgi:hypothetical protein
MYVFILPAVCCCTCVVDTDCNPCVVMHDIIFFISARSFQNSQSQSVGWLRQLAHPYHCMLMMLLFITVPITL